MSTATKANVQHQASAARTREQLLSAAPLVAVLQRLKQRMDGLVELAPHSDLASCMKAVVDDVARAIKDAQNIDVYVTVETLAQVTGRPDSTLRRICSHHGSECGASKVYGAWSIHLPTFLAFWQRGDHNLKEVA